MNNPLPVPSSHTVRRWPNHIATIAAICWGCSWADLPAQQVLTPQPVPITAVSAGARTAFPDNSGDFEYSAVGANQFRYGPNFPGGSSSWTPWTMGNGTGIASNGSGFTFQNPAAPQPGTRVAFVQGQGTMSTPYTFARGTWRLRFQGAQRKTQSTNRQVLRITIGTTEVFEQELVGIDYATYTTRALTFSAATAAVVTFTGINPYGGDNTALIDKIELEPIGNWSDVNTWNPPMVPGTANPVTIPAGVEVAMVGSMNAATVTVNGELVGTDRTADLNTRWVMVSGSGARFEVGRELTPFAQQFDLNLLGNDPTENVMNAGTKFLMAMDGGAIDMHGLGKRSWTSLNSITTYPAVPPNPPTCSITVADSTGWQVGDELVVAYTGHVSHVAGGAGCPSTPYSGPRSRQLTITSIHPMTGEIFLDGALPPAEHCTAAPSSRTNPQNGQTWMIDERAEVGALSRNVRITGSPTTIGLGGTVMIMACCTTMPTGFGRFTDVELTEMGQQQILGRYPMHWHMVRQFGDGQYVRNCSIHQTHNRAITIHGSSKVVVEGNVCFDVEGHAVFLEDGVEQDNHIIGNLVLAANKPASCQQMLPHDNSFDQPQNRSPASFWISHPNNHFIGNVAADSLGVGYWFALHQFPTGLSSTPTWIGQFSNTNGTVADLGTFADNTAHSLKMGVDIHDSIKDAVGAFTPMSPCSGAQPTPCASPTPLSCGTTLCDPRDDDILTNKQWNPSNPADLTGFRAYGCTTGLYSGGGIEYIDKITFSDCVLVDNGVHVHFASADTVTGSLLVHDSGNMIFPTGTPGTGNPTGNGMPNGHLHGFEKGNAYVVYDGPGNLRDSYLVGYDGVTSGNLTYSDFGAARRHTNHQFEKLVFAGGSTPNAAMRDFTVPGTPLVLLHPHVWGIAIHDVDGCLSRNLFPGYTLVSNHPMIHLTDLLGGQTPDVQLGPTAWLSPFKWGHLQLRYYAGTNTDALLQLNAVPSAGFDRRTYLTWKAEHFDSVFLPSAQMRQLPVLVRPAGSTATECVYEVEIRDPRPFQTTLPLHRVDLSIDDVGAGDVTRLVITQANHPTWSPVLYVNDNAQQIHYNGQNPSTTTLPTVAMPLNTSATVSTYQTVTAGGITSIELRMVNPGRTHRISIVW